MEWVVRAKRKYQHEHRRLTVWVSVSVGVAVSWGCSCRLDGVQLDRDVDAFSAKCGGDPPAQGEPDKKLPARQSASHDAYPDLVHLDALDAHYRRRVKELGTELVVGVGCAADLAQDVTDMADVHRERDGNVDHDPGPVP